MTGTNVAGFDKFGRRKSIVCNFNPRQRKHKGLLQRCRECAEAGHNTQIKRTQLRKKRMRFLKTACEPPKYRMRTKKSQISCKFLSSPKSRTRSKKPACGKYFPHAENVTSHAIQCPLLMTQGGDHRYIRRNSDKNGQYNILYSKKWFSEQKKPIIQFSLLSYPVIFLICVLFL